MARQPLAGTRAKIHRANQHIAGLKAELAAGSGRDYHVEKETGRENPNLITYRARADDDAMAAYGVVVGDVIHNLRSALDHTVWQLVLANGQTPDHRTMFPITRSSAEFEDRRGGLRGVSEQAHAVIESVQPYHTPEPSVAPENSFLWMLNELSRWDKHRVLNVTAARMSGWNIRIAGGLTRSMTSVPMPNPLAFGPLADGDVVHTIDLSGSPQDVDPIYDIKLGIAFAKDGPGQGQFVIQLLEGLSGRVVTIVDRLAPLVTR
jgi:hypothetical protein